MSHDEEHDSEGQEPEQQQAESLAAALDGQSSGDDALPEEMAAVRLLKLGDTELKTDRADAVFNRVMAGLEQKRSSGSVFGWHWRGLIPLGAAAVAMVLLLLLLSGGHGPVVKMPAPGSVLLHAQGKAAAGHDMGELQENMRGYRLKMFAALGCSLSGGG